MAPDDAPLAPPGSASARPRRARIARRLSALLLLAGLAGYALAAAVALMGLASPPWWAWLWLAVPATVASWIVLLLGRTPAGTNA